MPKTSDLTQVWVKVGLPEIQTGIILNDTNFRRSRRQFHHVGAEYNEEAKTARQTAQVPSTNQHSYCITNSTGGKCLLCLPSNQMNHMQICAMPTCFDMFQRQIFFDNKKNILKNVFWVLGGGKGYFSYPSKLFYIKGIGVGQTPIFCHF